MFYYIQYPSIKMHFLQWKSKAMEILKYTISMVPFITSQIKKKTPTGS